MKAIERKVLEINELIEFCNTNNVLVTFTDSTWQTPHKYEPLKLSRGCVYSTYYVLDLYDHLKFKHNNWKKETETYPKSSFDQIGDLNYLKKHIKKSIKNNF